MTRMATHTIVTAGHPVEVASRCRQFEAKGWEVKLIQPIPKGGTYIVFEADPITTDDMAKAAYPEVPA